MKVPSTLVALASAALAIPAAAAPQAPQRAVSYSDLDLTTEAGQAVLATRINWAARLVCNVSDERTGSILPPPDAKACYDRAKATALQQVAEAAARAKARG